MEIIKDFLTLFLQLTAIQVLVFTSWFVRSPKLKLATSIFVLNIDLALRNKVYGECICLSDILNQIQKNCTTGQERILIGYRNPIRGIEVIKELSEWESAPKYFGPVQYANGDTKERWNSEFELLKWQFGIIEDEHSSELQPEFSQPLLRRLSRTVNRKYGYELENVDSAEKAPAKSIFFCENENDVFVYLIMELEKKCPNNKEKVEAIIRLHDASKIINIVQIKNPYHASINNIHLYISNENRGVMKLVTEFVEKQGFSVANNTSQDAHLILNELPPNSERYCLLETRQRSLTEKDIKMQSNLLLDKLSPQVMKPILIRSTIISVLVVLLSKYIDVETIGNFQLLFQNFVSTKT